MRNIIYNKWLTQDKLFPWHDQLILNHSLLILNKYYTNLQYHHFTEQIHAYFTPNQLRDTRHILLPLVLLQVYISTIEWNPENVINTY